LQPVDKNAANPEPAAALTAPPGHLRRLMAVVYDVFLLTAVLLVAFFPVPLIPAEWRASLPVRLGLQCHLLAVTGFFFVRPWSRGGQTLGMRAWRLRLVADGGAPVGTARALLRFAVAFASAAAFGLGFFWIFLDPGRRTWHDIAAATRIVTVPKPSPPAR